MHKLRVIAFATDVFFCAFRPYFSGCLSVFFGSSRYTLDSLLTCNGLDQHGPRYHSGFPLCHYKCYTATVFWQLARACGVPAVVIQAVDCWILDVFI